MKQKKKDMVQSSELKELTMIRKLLMALLVKAGADSNEIGSVLGLNASTVRHIFPFRKIKKQGIENERARTKGISKRSSTS